MSTRASTNERSEMPDSVQSIDADGVAQARARLPSPEELSRLTSLLSLMSDPVRLRILYALDVSEELCVSDLAPDARGQ